MTKSSDRSVQVWDFETRKPLMAPIRLTLPGAHVRFSPDGRCVVTSGAGNLVRFWDSETGELQSATLRRSNWREPVAMSADGRLVLTFQREQARVWDMGIIEDKPLAISPMDFYREQSFSRNGRFQARIQGDNAVHTIDRRSGKPLAQPIIPGVAVRRAFFGKESDLLLTESADARLRVWDLPAGESLTPLLKTRYDLEPPLLSRQDLPLTGRPSAQLVLLAQLLSGNQIGETGGAHPVESGQLFAMWRQLKAACPETLTLSPDSAAAWHEQEASHCEAAWDWWPAIFHLSHLIADRPNDAALQERFSYAQLALAQANQRKGGYIARRHACPPRDPALGPELIDLTRYYNTSKKVRLSSAPTMPFGVPELAGTRFDVRGAVQLSSGQEKKNGGRYPERIDGIEVRPRVPAFAFPSRREF